MEGIVLFSWLLFLQFAFSVSKDTLAVNQTFKDGDLLISEGKTFALGFFSPASSSYRYLGIWFHKVSLQTVVWVANRDDPITGSSGFLSINRQLKDLVLYENKSSSPVWLTNVSTEAADVWEAKLLDSGNLILFGRNNRILWQSFKHPTNTMLLGMKIGLNRKTGVNTFLTSWRSLSDPGMGNYSYSINPIGSPQYFLNNGTEHYWRTLQYPWPRKTLSEVYHCEFVNNDEIYHNCSFYDPSIITMVELDESGSIRRLIWQESEGQWIKFQSFPLDRCDVYGRCGAYGKCDANTANRFECSCLPGFEPKSVEHWHLSDWKHGCVRKRKASFSICGNGEGFMKVESVKLPDALVAVWVDTSMNLMDCEQECKSNCSCSAYSIVDYDPGNRTKCLAWYGELIDTRTYIADIGYDLYVRVDSLELGQGVRRSSSFLAVKGKLSRLIIFIPSTWLVIVIIIYCWLKKRKRARKSKRRRRIVDSTHILSGGNELEEGSSSDQDLMFFDFSTILAATGNFSSANKIGQGGFGAVYKGHLSNGLEIAVKRMSKSSNQGTGEFKNEVKLIAKLQLRNLVKLLGCCIKRKEKILIYEYLANKSLDSFLVDVKRRPMMDWEKRFDIVAGIARGMLYLHQDSRLTIIHRDLKSSNILLDAKMNPKISDFGMARIFYGDQIEGRTKRVVGTYGYMSPEYGLFGKFSVKSDVFSFGIIILEVVSGEKSSSFHQEDPYLSLIGQVWELWSEGRALEIVDSSLNGSYNSDEALRCIQVGLLCIQEDAIDRPTMSEVSLMLKSEKALRPPKQPAFIFKTSSSNGRSPEVEEGNYSMNEMTISDVVLTR
ncbi:G-type lectin S-receptor-like serine/threonine-protein kinase At1g11410 [Euphorbia peplus]|nr:G-type lectin S-receptor-like serine/threonine-protein kinase At1g11410 [Euphorbia peplus]